MGTNRVSRRPEDADPERTILGEKANHDLERPCVAALGTAIVLSSFCLPTEGPLS